MFEDIETELKDYVKECGEKGWDGYFAPPIKQETVDLALKTLNLFREHLQKSGKEHKIEIEACPISHGGITLTLKYCHRWTRKDFEVCFSFENDIEGIEAIALSCIGKIIAEIPEKIITPDELPTYFDWILRKQS
jgi:hypothetical protein